VEIKKISYSNATNDRVHDWLEHIVEQVILEHIKISSNNKVELKVSKYLQEKSNI
jgi:hypothetical protein